MDIRKSLLVFCLLGLVACDPEMETTFAVSNNADNAIKFHLFGFESDSFSLEVGESKTFIVIGGMGGGFGAIADYDSVQIEVNSEDYWWYRPDNTFGYIDTEHAVGQDRNMPKDFYNTKDWKIVIDDDEEDWIFYLDQEDINRLLGQ